MFAPGSRILNALGGYELKRYVIVGGVAGGMSAAARLRRLDESADIVVFERGEHVSFANCGLPYYVGDVITDRAKLLVQTPESLKARLNLDIRTRTTVEAIDRQAKQVTVKDATGNTYIQEYDYLVMAPGAEPVRPNLPGIDHPRILTVRTIDDVDRIKEYIKKEQVKSALVVGGGFIGLEMAENLLKAKVEVRLVEMAQQVLSTMLDADMAAFVHQHIRNNGIHLHLGSAVQGFHSNHNSVMVKLTNGAHYPTDLVILAIGVRPDVTLAKSAGIKLGERGGIAVDKHLRTSDPYIYAVGDAIEVQDLVTGRSALIPLAGPANKQGRMAADNIMGMNRTYTATQGTAIVSFMGLTIAGTGSTSATLARHDLMFTSSTTHSFPHATYYPGGSLMTIKLLFDPTSGRLYGAQIVGNEGVDKRIDVLATVLRMQGSVQQLQELELAYTPAFSSAKDPVNVAGYVAGNMISQHVKMVTVTQLASLPESALYLDVRAYEDFLVGHIKGSINIPLPQLRHRLHELPKTGQIVVICRIGHQAYLAARILMQCGFSDVMNLSGGWRSYKAYMDDKAATAEQAASIPRGAAQPERTVAPVSPSPQVPTDLAATVLDVTGLACPGPIVQVNAAMRNLTPGSLLEIHASDPGFAADIAAWCGNTGNTLLQSRHEHNKYIVRIRKGTQALDVEATSTSSLPHDKTIIVFSGDLDKAIAAFVIATGALAMNRRVTLFFTFWGLNILRRNEKVTVKKGFMDRIFSLMMPRGSRKLGLSRMNMAGIGPKLIRRVMGGKNIGSLEEMVEQAMAAGVRIVACQMSMDVMGIKREELIPGVEIGGVATYLAAAEDADTNLFI
ncbi:MAG TPA: FAD-dependent oxidoreductase [Firmicutes bacterium]|jgi:NADPH-dependent 2,4-dienoyl-CoA reductase/sulfur reductase-like enzyme/peroxiredoxin family protein/rhodanese-related sulfurtransferase/TusA-related sulfurtransferase|nr:FAD-dependent oxidoreductase [Bacillota bacterium]